LIHSSWSSHYRGIHDDGRLLRSVSSSYRVGDFVAINTGVYGSQLCASRSTVSIWMPYLDCNAAECTGDHVRLELWRCMFSPRPSNGSPRSWLLRIPTSVRRAPLRPILRPRRASSSKATSRFVENTPPICHQRRERRLATPLDTEFQSYTTTQGQSIDRPPTPASPSYLFDAWRTLDWLQSLFARIPSHAWARNSRTDLSHLWHYRELILPIRVIICLTATLCLLQISADPNSFQALSVFGKVTQKAPTLYRHEHVLLSKHNLRRQRWLPGLPSAMLQVASSTRPRIGHTRPVVVAARNRIHPELKAHLLPSPRSTRRLPPIARRPAMVPILRVHRSLRAHGSLPMKTQQL